MFIIPTVSLSVPVSMPMENMYNFVLHESHVLGAESCEAVGRE